MISLVARVCTIENKLVEKSKTYRFNKRTYGKEYADQFVKEVEIPPWTSSILEQSS